MCNGVSKYWKIFTCKIQFGLSFTRADFCARTLGDLISNNPDAPCFYLFGAIGERSPMPHFNRALGGALEDAKCIDPTSPTLSLKILGGPPALARERERNVYTRIETYRTHFNRTSYCFEKHV